MEEWRDVLGWVGFYQVSDLGRVRSLDREILALDRGGKISARKYKGRVLSARKGKNGYVLVCLTKNCERKHRSVHTLVAEAFLGPCPAGHEVCHWNNVRHDNRLKNLRYDTRSENALDRHRHGTMLRDKTLKGEEIGTHVLTEEDVRHIRANLGYGKLTALSLELNVSITTVWCVARNKSWRHII